MPGTTMPTRDQRALRDVVPLAVTTVAWAGSLALVRFGSWDDQPVVGWIAIGLNVAIGIVWIVVHARYLRGVDELQRKIMLDAIGIALGASLVGGFALAAASQSGLIGSEVNLGYLSAVPAVVYLVAIAVGTLRYR